MSAALAETSWWARYGDGIVFTVSVIVVALVVTRIGTIAVRRLQRRIEAAQSAKQELALQRATTVAHTLNYVVRVVVWTVAGLTLLSRMTVNIGPLLASAGVLGVALGFGAQSIVRDYLSGFYLVVEDQLDVGDVVDIFSAGVKLSGRVTELTLRTTSLRTEDGLVHVVPNGGISWVTNHSRGGGDVVVTARVDAGEDRDDEIRRAIEELLGELHGDRDVRRALFDGPAVRHVARVGDRLEIEVAAIARPDRREDLARRLRERLEHRLRPLPADVQVRVEAPRDVEGG